MERIIEYIHKSQILRQIHSDKANKYRKINSFQNIITVIVSSFITFMGFYGIANLNSLINRFIKVDISVFQFFFNLLVFILFVNIIFHLVFHFYKKQTEAEKAVVILTSFINETTDIIENTRNKSSVMNNDIIDNVRYKYLTLTSVIPSNTDKEYIKAKKNFKGKELIKNSLEKINPEIFDEMFLRNYTSNLIKSSSLYQYLKELRNVNPELYLGGGAVRNLVWDDLHGYKMYSQIADLDIIYFDKINNSKENDKKFEDLLYKKIPNIKWSVKNQARMHIWNKEEAYKTFEEALSKWPETCTAIAVKLNDDDDIDFVAPFGFGDLYRLIITPTPHFKTKIDRFRERYTSKKWLLTWPKLKVIEP